MAKFKEWFEDYKVKLFPLALTIGFFILFRISILFTDALPTTIYHQQAIDLLSYQYEFQHYLSMEEKDQKIKEKEKELKHETDQFLTFFLGTLVFIFILYTIHRPAGSVYDKFS